jgi:hypothetical protein
MTGPRVLRALPETEEGFAGWVIDRAHLSGWTVAHFRAARTVHGWRTPVAADGAGFFDLTLIRPPRVIFAELKTDRGTLEVDQARWHALARDCPGVETHLWRPKHRDLITAVLR